MSVISENRSRCVEYKTATGTAEFFHEVINPPTVIMIFGAGHDAVPLSQLSSRLGWRVSVIDHRPAWATAERFPEADEVLVLRADEIGHEFFKDEHFVAVVMNHNYDADRELLRRLLPSTCRYVGVLGPKTRTEKLIDELREQGSFFSNEQLDRLYAPVGLDIGASTPEGIQAVLAGRHGGSLRHRQRPIYDR
jgi:xanthine/CO dehydrogenase XdhC/CoxF family maturation factor